MEQRRNARTSDTGDPEKTRRPAESSGTIGFALGVSRFPRPCMPALVHTQLTPHSSPLKTSMLRAVQISPLHYIQEDTGCHAGRDCINFKSSPRITKEVSASACLTNDVSSMSRKRLETCVLMQQRRQRDFATAFVRGGSSFKTNKSFPNSALAVGQVVIACRPGRMLLGTIGKVPADLSHGVTFSSRGRPAMPSWRTGNDSTRNDALCPARALALESSRLLFILLHLLVDLPWRSWLVRHRSGVREALGSNPGQANRVPGSIPDEAPPGLSHVGIVPNDATGGRVFSGISRFPTQDLDVKSRSNLFTSLWHYLQGQ
ncbi:hypothetical protein PR048_004601 [Dryococelus australis]|uniref:Uncharacterized protein n=1 Tax=Dryococelus australis TaxID=614101 RepID=A0ABQ9I5W4_9NEOP|nr:hypothetical protein PR048_004601 [Dryococelus australis]